MFATLPKHQASFPSHLCQLKLKLQSDPPTTLPCTLLLTHCNVAWHELLPVTKQSQSKTCQALGRLLEKGWEEAWAVLTRPADSRRLAGSPLPLHPPFPRRSMHTRLPTAVVTATAKTTSLRLCRIELLSLKELEQLQFHLYPKFLCIALELILKVFPGWDIGKTIKSNKITED